MSDHHCKGCIVYCMDFRLHDGLKRFMNDHGLMDDGTDVIRVAGAAKTLTRPKDPRDRAWLFEQLKISHDLHHSRTFYLINHEDCGAYGAENIKDPDEEWQIHRQDLSAAQAEVKRVFSDVEVHTFIMHLDGHAEPVS